MEKDIENILYHYVIDGEEGFDLSEVLLMNNIDDIRVKKLIKLLDNEDRYIVYQSMLILIAWNINEGFEKFNQFFLERWDNKEEFEPHRIYGKDNVYDIISKSFKISTYNGNTEFNLLSFIKIFLELYSDVYFESNLKDLLLNNTYFKILLPEIKKTIDDNINNTNYYQASQLFPVIVLYQKDNYNLYKDIFTELLNKDERIQYNVDEAIKYL